MVRATTATSGPVASGPEDGLLEGVGEEDESELPHLRKGEGEGQGRWSVPRRKAWASRKRTALRHEDEGDESGDPGGLRGHEAEVDRGPHGDEEEPSEEALNGSTSLSSSCRYSLVARRRRRERSRGRREADPGHEEGDADHEEERGPR